MRRPVAVAMAHVAVVAVGLVTLGRMPVSLLPELAFPRLVAWTTLPRAAPAEVERLVTEPVEEALANVPGARRVESVSREGESVVTLAFPWGTDMGLARLDARERLDELLSRLPPGADRPTVLRVDPGARPILVARATRAARDAPDALPGSVHDLGTVAEAVFRRRLEQVDGIGRVTVVGAERREVAVDVDPLRAEALGLSVGAIANALDRADATGPGGTVRRGPSRLALRVLGRLEDVHSLERTVVGRAPGGAATRLADVARVRDTLAPRESSTWAAGRPAVGLLVYRESGASVVAASRRATALLDSLADAAPGVDLAVVASRSAFVTAAIASVVQSLALGGLLAFLVLFPFLRDPRWPALLALAIPVSMAAALPPLHAAGVGLDVVSLGGLALGAGMLVDNAIVVLENVFRHREAGLDPLTAAARGAREVQGAVLASTLTTIVVFGPVLYVGGLAGALFGELALAVALSLVASLLVALTLVPALAARLGPARAPGHAPFARALDGFDRSFARLAAVYERALDRALRRRGAVLASAAFALAGAVAIGLRLPRDVLPDVDERAFEVRLALPSGTPLERTESLALDVDRWLRARPDVAATLVRAGRASADEIADATARGRHAAVVDVRLAPDGPPTRAVTAALAAAFGHLPDGTLTVETGRATDVGALLGTAGGDLVVEVAGSDLDRLRTTAGRVARRLAADPLLANVEAPTAHAIPEVRVEPDREAIARHGLAAATVVQTVTDVARGRVAAGLAAGERDVPVVVRARSTQGDLAALAATTVDGVPLGLLVRAREGAGPAAIRRVDGERVVAVHVDVRSGGVEAATRRVERALAGIDVPTGVRVEVGGAAGETAETFRSLGVAFLLALVLVYLVLAAQFESLLDPLVVLVAVPLALPGAIAALALTGRGLDATSLIGVVVLVGIAVNDAIVKVDVVRRTRAVGSDLVSALRSAGRQRLRPIVMTTATTVLGLLPMALASGRGAELRASLAVTVIGGTLASTALTLLVVPVVYSLVDGVRTGLRRA